MLLAIDALDPTVRMIFLAIAVILFLLAAFGYRRGNISFLALGLAAFAFPAFWDALAAT